jgi:hypothetical protein
MHKSSSSINSDLFEQVSPRYTHASKIAQPAAAVTTSTMYLKWYLVYPEVRTFDGNEVRNVQAFVVEEVGQGRLALHNEVGFVVQHRATAGDILYVCSWRENNELWETICFKSLEVGSVFEVVNRDTKTGTFCVWVIPIVAHEQQAWVQYLRSAQDEAAKLAYFQNQLRGVVG